MMNLIAVNCLNILLFLKLSEQITSFEEVVEKQYGQDIAKGNIGCEVKSVSEKRKRRCGGCSKEGRKTSYIINTSSNISGSNSSWGKKKKKSVSFNGSNPSLV